MLFFRLLSHLMELQLSLFHYNFETNTLEFFPSPLLKSHFPIYYIHQIYRILPLLNSFLYLFLSILYILQMLFLRFFLHYFLLHNLPLSILCNSQTLLFLSLSHLTGLQLSLFCYNLVTGMMESSLNPLPVLHFPSCCILRIHHHLLLLNFFQF